MLYSKLAFVALMSLAMVTNIIGTTQNEALCSLDTAGIITYFGYTPDTRQVTTPDGYILTVHCLFNADTVNTTLNPVIAWHGLMDASHTFVMNSRNQSLAFLLADQGYFVCLPNARGNTYSRGHTDPNKNANLIVGPFWEFSWDQIAEFDVPTVIDAVRSWTNKTKVIYIGHSQGATSMFALLSLKPAYNAKISIFAGLGPVTFFKHTTCLPYVGASNLLATFEALYGFEFLPHTMLQTILTFAVCTLPTQALCSNLLFLLFGESSHLNYEKLPVFTCKSPADFAWGQFTQYAQHVKVNKFQKYDFHWLGNLLEYGQWSPPEYDLTKVTAPVALFYSGSDVTTTNPDILTLKSKLSSVVHEQNLTASMGFNHLDYVWASDVREIVYEELINLIKSY